MKIISDKDWWIVVCIACGVTLRAKPKDVKPRDRSDSDGDLCGTYIRWLSALCVDSHTAFLTTWLLQD